MRPGEPLVRTVEHQLDDAELELVGHLSLELDPDRRELGWIVGAAGHRRQGDHDSGRVCRVVGQAPPALDLFGVAELGRAEVGDQRRAGVAGLGGVVPDRLVGAQEPVHTTKGLTGQPHRRRLLQFTVGLTVLVLRHAGRGVCRRDLLLAHEGGVHGAQVRTGVVHEDRAGLADPIEVFGQQTFAGEIDRIETPRQQGFGRDRSSRPRLRPAGR